MGPVSGARHRAQPARPGPAGLHLPIPGRSRCKSARPRRARQPSDGNGAAPALREGLLESLQDAVAAADGGGTITAASARLEDMFGYGLGEMVCPLADGFLDGLKDAVRNQRPLSPAPLPPSPSPRRRRMCLSRGWCCTARRSPATEVARRAGHGVAVLLEDLRTASTVRPTPPTSASPTPSAPRTPSPNPGARKTETASRHLERRRSKARKARIGV